MSEIPPRPRQLAFDLPVDSRHGVEDFLVGASNEAAYGLIERWPAWPEAWLRLTGTEDFIDVDLVGEFDGGSKYGPERQFKRDVSIAELVEAERERERRLRRVTSGVVRWDWPVAMNRDRLAARLAEHGVVRASGRGSRAV